MKVKITATFDNEYKSEYSEVHTKKQFIEDEIKVPKEGTYKEGSDVYDRYIELWAQSDYTSGLFCIGEVVSIKVEYVE